MESHTYLVEKGVRYVREVVVVEKITGKSRLMALAVCVSIVCVSMFGWIRQESFAEAKKAGSDKIIIGIDPGHQLRGNSDLEAAGPGAQAKKAKVTGGTTGVSTGVPEYKLNLKIAKKVKKELEARGYEVVMTRDKHDVDISNKERAKLINKSGADICIRLHADGAESSSVAGASVLYPSKSNPYVGKLSRKSYKLAKAVISSYTEETGLRDRGCVVRDDLTGTNWSKIPVILLEMGFMSNPAEDEKMQKKKFQKKMVQGICDGIDAYYQ